MALHRRTILLQRVREHSTIDRNEGVLHRGSGDQLAFDDHWYGVARTMLASLEINTTQRKSQGAGTLTASSPLLITRRCGFGRSQMHAHPVWSHPLTLCSLPETVQELVNIGTIKSVRDCSRASFNSTIPGQAKQLELEKIRTRRYG
jgi:hypothetical protein